MILKESYSVEWIRSIHQEYRCDPILTEKVILALTLLQQLEINELNFIFKGGTSLILLLGEAKRLSIDIDIIVNPEFRASLEGVLEKIVQQSVFLKCEKNERASKISIPKAHYKFYYKSSVSGKNEYVLLDVLFEENPYIQNIRIPVYSKFIKCDESKIEVLVPSINCILGDKLTAFAPNTTGIPYNSGKELEIVKQLFDVANLFDLADDISVLKDTFDRIAKQEISYRGLDLTVDDVLMDIYETASVIAYRGKKDEMHFKELITGAKKINSFIISGTFNIETAIICASKAAYLSMALLRNVGVIEKYTGIDDVGVLQIEHSEYIKFNKLKKTNIQAFFYWYKAVELYGGTGIDGGVVTLGHGMSV